MWQFVKYTLATIVGMFLFLLVSIILVAGIGSAMSSSDSEYELKENSILKLDLNRPMGENASNEDNPFSDFPNPFFSQFPWSKHPQKPYFRPWDDPKRTGVPHFVTILVAQNQPRCAKRT